MASNERCQISACKQKIFGGGSVPVCEKHFSLVQRFRLYTFHSTSKDKQFFLLIHTTCSNIKKYRNNAWNI